MPDLMISARRIGILDGAAPLPASNKVVVEALPPAARFVLRLAAADAARIGTAAGINLSLPINQYAGSTRLGARIGPDEWLLIAPEADTEPLRAALSTTLAGVHHALVDIGHRNSAFEVVGPAAADVLNAGCPLDLGRFPVGNATRTLLAKAEIVLLRLPDRDAAACYRLECWRSFGRYVHAFLAEAALEFASSRG